MAKGDTFLAPTILTATDPEELSKLVIAERIKRNQSHATAQYSAVWVRRADRTGYMKFVAFVEFNTEEK